MELIYNNILFKTFLRNRIIDLNHFYYLMIHKHLFSPAHV